MDLNQAIKSLSPQGKRTFIEPSPGLNEPVEYKHKKSIKTFRWVCDKLTM